MTIVGLLVGFLAILFLPLHRVRLFGSLVALSVLVIGADFQAMCSMDIPDSRFPDSRIVFLGAAMIGAAIGYFAGWVQSAFRRS